MTGSGEEGKGHRGDFAVTRDQGMGCDLRALTPTRVLLWDWPGLKLNQISWLPLLGEAGCPGKRTLARVRIQTLIPLLTVQVPLAESLVSGPHLEALLPRFPGQGALAFLSAADTMSNPPVPHPPQILEGRLAARETAPLRTNPLSSFSRMPRPLTSNPGSLTPARLTPLPFS